MNRTGNRSKPRDMNHDTRASKLFPLEVRAMLQRAAQTPISFGDPYARMKAVNRAIARARQMHPDYFRADDPDPTAAQPGKLAGGSLLDGR
jgi:hypothetical protein